MFVSFNDPASLESKISPQSGMIITEGVFSMDGDQAPLNRLYDIAQRTGNILFVDDAHGFGVHGSEGRGTVDLQGLRHRDIDVIMGTFGKALGTSGAFVAGSKDFIDYMINFSREYVYSTHMAPSVAYATLQAVKIVRSGEHLRRKLGENLRYFKRALEQLSLTASQSVTSIQPIVTGSSEKALQWSRELVNHGCYVSAIRHPTVPKNTARLRITITARHSFEQIDKLTEGLFACLQLR
jgi:8-amino-7-oxononanoate synthase